MGANDITNPQRKPIPVHLFTACYFGCGKAKSVLFVKRSLASGYAGVENDLFYLDNTYMLFGDAKVMLESIAKALSTLNVWQTE